MTVPDDRSVALRMYDGLRNDFSSREACARHIADFMGKHVNTITGWIRDEYGPIQRLAAGEIDTEVKRLREMVSRLRDEKAALLREAAER